MPSKRRGNPKAASLSSRKPSAATTTNPTTQNNDDPAEGTSAPGTWQEPSVLNLPSYMEYNGTPRSQVTDDMQPLGSLPTNAVKLRVKPPKPQLFRSLVRSKKTGVSSTKERKEQVGSAASSQPLVTPSSTESFHPMITRKRTQSHRTQGESEVSTRPVSQIPQEVISRPRRSASKTPKDPIAQPPRSSSRKLEDPIPPTRRSASRRPQDPIAPTRRSVTHKPQDPVVSTRRSASRKLPDSTLPTHPSETHPSTGPTHRSRSRRIENRTRAAQRSQSRQLENQGPAINSLRPVKVEDQVPNQTLLSKEQDDQENMSKGNAEGSLLKTAPAPPTAYPGPSSRTSVGQKRLKQVVDAAVQRSITIGSPVIGLAIKKLHEESLHDRTLADLLDGVLSQEPTNQQTVDFQAFIKAARKQIKAEKGSARRASQRTRLSTSRHTGAQKTPSDVAGHSKPFPNTENPPSLPQDTIIATKHALDPEEPSPKRRKISRSVSTSSSLSSIPSNDHELSPIAKGDQVNATKPIMKHTRRGETGLAPRANRISDIPQPHKKKSLGPPSRDPSVQEKEPMDKDVCEAEKRMRSGLIHTTSVDSNLRNEHFPSDQARVPPIKPKPAFTLTQPRPPGAGSRKRKADDEDSIHSATSSHGELLIPPPPGARATSRGTTPNPSGRPAKRIKTARVKMSPEKKKKGVIPGIGRTSGRKGVKTNYAEDIEVDDNDDACAACGGNGKLLCCDSCPSAFHFSCVDPPLDEDNPPEGEWHCNKCRSKTNSLAKTSHGLFSELIDNMEKRNPSVYGLPRDLRDRYEGVRTGDKGEYQEFTEVGTKTKLKTYDEAVAESLRLKDKTGKTILCYSCHQSSLGGRPLVQCDYCPLRWHLDCLHPPRASLPFKQPSGNPRHTWMCPNHVEHELRAIDTSIKAAGEANPAGKVYRLRKPRNVRVIEPAISRGLSNDGLIDIINEPSDDEEVKNNQDLTLFRISEKGIKLDFINKMRQCNEEENARNAVGEWAAANEVFDQARFIDRQAALNLAHFATGHPELGLTPQRVEELTHALIAEAPADVISLITKEEQSTRLSTIPEEESTDAPGRPAPSSSAAGTEKQQLELLQELIRRRLAAVASSG